MSRLTDFGGQGRGRGGGVNPSIKEEGEGGGIQELVAVSRNFLKGIPSKLEIQCRAGVYFSFNFAWNSIQLDLVR